MPCRKHGSALDARRSGLKCLFSPMPSFSVDHASAFAGSFNSSCEFFFRFVRNFRFAKKQGGSSEKDTGLVRNFIYNERIVVDDLEFED